MPPEYSSEDAENANRLDVHIADAEQRVTEQALHLARLMFVGQDGSEAMRTLRALEDALVSLMKARVALGVRRPKTATFDT